MPWMIEKIAQHKHCRKCGKAFIGDGTECSEKCKEEYENTMQKKKRQLIILYIATFIILILALIYVGI
ncbi:MAG: DUF2116 family Zn-ribbon domain-containing protein [Methanomassiliicoccales archaeon]